MSRHIVLMFSGFFLFLVDSTGLEAQWVKLNQYNGTFYNEVYFFDQNLGFITGHTGSILRTSNSGTTWTTVILPNASFSANRDICFVSTSTGFVSGEDGIWKTVNGGLSWTNVTPTGATTISSSSCWFRNPSVGVWGYGSCRDTTVTFWRTTNGGTTWTSVTYNHPAPDVAVGGMTYSGNSFYAAGGNGKFWSSTDDGATWTSSNTNSAGWQEDLITTSSALLLASANGTSCIASGGGKILVSTNGGTNWTTTSFPTTVMWGISMYSATHGWAVGDSAKAYKTTDGGVSWAESSCGLIPGDRLDDVAMISATHGFAVGDGIYQFTLDEFSSDPDTIDFGDVLIGTSRGDSLATVRSIGNSGLITSRTILGTNSPDFSSPDPLTSPLTVPECGSASTRVRFGPLTTGVKAARIEHIIAGFNDTLIVYLRGKGVRPRIIGDRYHRFDTLVCENEAFDTIRITNNGDHPLEIDTIAIAKYTGFFSIVDPPFPLTIPPFQSHQIVVRGRAVGAGKMGERLYFYTNDPDFQDSLWTLDVSMYKHDIGLSFMPDTLLVIPSSTPGTVSRANLLLRNDGSMAQRVELGKGTDEVIRITSKTSFELSANDSITIEFEAQAFDTAARCRRFKITTQPCDQVYYVTVCYQAVEGKLTFPPLPTLTADCGETDEETTYFSNEGNADVVIDSVMVTGSDASMFSYRIPAPLPLMLSAGRSQEIIFEYTAQNSLPGKHTAYLIFYINGKEPDTIQLRGHTSGPELFLFPHAINLGFICPDDDTISTVIIENLGDADAEITGVLPTENNRWIAKIEVPESVPSKGTDSLNFVVKSNEPGPFTERIVLTYKPCDRSDTITVMGKIRAAALKIEPHELDFGNLPLGQTRNDSVALENLSDDPVRVLLTGPSRPDADVQLVFPGEATDLISGNTIDIEVAVTPTRIGEGTDTITISGSGSCNEILILPIRWNGIEGKVRHSGDIVFEDVKCQELPEKVLMIYNGSDDSISVDSISVEKIIPSEANKVEWEVAGALPATIPPRDSLEVIVRFAQSDSGKLLEYLTFRIESDSGIFDTSLVVEVRGRREYPSSLFIDQTTGHKVDSVAFPALYTCRPTLDTFLTIQNSGNLTDTLDLISTDPAILQILSTSPLPIQSGQSKKISVRLQGSSVVQGVPRLIATSRVCGDEQHLDIDIEFVESLLQLPDTISFGDICIGDSITTTLPLKNTLADSVIISFYLPGTGDYSLRPAEPITLESGKNDLLLLDFLPINEGLNQTELRITITISAPCTEERSIVLTAHGVECPDPDITLKADTHLGRWGQRVSIPIMMDAAYMNAAEGFSFIITTEPTLLEPRAIRLASKASEMFDLDSSFTVDSGIIHLSFSVYENAERRSEERGFDDTLVIMDFDVLRSPYISSVIGIDRGDVRPAGRLRNANGRFLLEDYCDAHGRLLNISGNLALKPIYPNPVSDITTIEYEIPFSDYATLKVYDVQGNEVLTLLDGVVPPGGRRAEVDVARLPSGLYTVRLAIGTQSLSQRFVVGK